MHRLKVPGTKLQLSRAVLGTMTFGDQVDEQVAVAMLERCAAAGVAMVDTANVYAGGRSEELLGRLLSRWPDTFAVATKVGGTPNPDAPDSPPLSAAAIRAGVEGSLRRLRRDRVDVCHFHQPDRTTPISESLEELGRLVDEGKVAALGVSNFSAWQISELSWISRTRGLPAPRLSQPIYNLLARRLEEEYEEYATQAGLMSVVYNPLAGGLLTGKYRSVTEPESGTRFGLASLGRMYQQRYWNDDVRAAADKLATIAAEAGTTLTDLALRWLLTRPAVGAVLIGASTIDQLDANLSAIQGPPLDADVLHSCDEVWAQLRGAAPVYNR